MRIADYQIIMDGVSVRNELEEKTSGAVLGGQAQTVSPRGGAVTTTAGGIAIQQDRVDISLAAHLSVEQYSRNLFSSTSEVNDSATSSTQVIQERLLAESLTSTVLEQQIVLSGIRTVQSQRQSQPNLSFSEGQLPFSLQGGAFSAQNTGMTATVYSREVKVSSTQLGVQASGIIQTEDGRTIDFSMELLMQRDMASIAEQRLDVSYNRETVNMTDPLILQIDGNLPELSDTVFTFDLNNDGKLENISTLKQGSAFLSLDKNGNGQIDSGNELFGPASGNGFADLSAYDLDGNNWIDENDAVFESLSLWFKDDKGQDVLKGLKDAGIGAIYLGSARGGITLTDGAANTLGEVQRTGFYVKEDGSVKPMQQIDLASRPMEEPLKQEDSSPYSFLQASLPHFERTPADLDQLNGVLRKLEDGINQSRRSLDAHFARRKEKDESQTTVDKLIQMMENLKSSARKSRIGDFFPSKQKW